MAEKTPSRQASPSISTARTEKTTRVEAITAAALASRVSNTARSPVRTFVAHRKGFTRSRLRNRERSARSSRMPRSGGKPNGSGS
ncbi:MAG: hypothetical protein RMK73_10215 [Geminicoccaceae bacterium]|nr:hypothetical protein [Geminicoccaceae bacterium]MDW8123738.1 hypothetical protein [Geminicoccaceae bacterium]MDW8341843.1 hypothetical protein [Geminicoccaceae bacterium]